MLNIMEMYMYIAHGVDMQPPHQANLFSQHRTTVHLYLLDIHQTSPKLGFFKKPTCVKASLTQFGNKFMVHVIKFRKDHKEEAWRGKSPSKNRKFTITKSKSSRLSEILDETNPFANYIFTSLIILCSIILRK